MKPSKRKKERLIELTSTRESKGVRRKLIKKNRRRKVKIGKTVKEGPKRNLTTNLIWSRESGESRQATGAPPWTVGAE